jgi:hypothetical protein
MTHDCPKDGCSRQVSAGYLACRAHWQQVTRPTQQLVYATYAGGLGLFDPEYLEARDLAIAEMNRVGNCPRCKHPILDAQPRVVSGPDLIHVACMLERDPHGGQEA